MKSFISSFYLMLFCSIITSCFPSTQSDGPVNDRLGDYNFESQTILDQWPMDAEISIHLDDVEERGYFSNKDVFSNRRFIFLKTPPEIIIGQVYKLVISDKHIMLLDRNITQRVYLFSDQGDFLFSVGKEGDGPGEYLYPRDIFIHDTTLLVMDKAFNLHAFNLKNEYLKSQRLPFYGQSMFLDSKGAMFFANNNTYEEALAYHILGLKDFEFQGAYLPIHGDGLLNRAANPLTYNLGLSKNTFLHAPSYSSGIYEASREGVRLKLKMEGVNPVPKSAFTSWEALDQGRAESFYFYPTVRNPILESSNYLLFLASNAKMLSTIVVDKRNLQAYSFRGFKDDLFFGANQSQPMAVYGEYFYSVLEVEELISLKSQVEAIKDNSVLEEFKVNNPEVWYLIQNIDASSNPVIMVSELNIGEEN